MSVQIHLARHGQTEWHAENRYAGISDIALTDQGRKQASALGRWAAAAELVGVVSSELTRAVETAQIVAEVAAVPHRTVAALRESDFGRGEGRTREEMAAEFPAALSAFTERPASSPLPEGEPGAQAAHRFLAALRQIADQDGGPVLVVAHTTVMRLSLCQLLGIPLDDYRTVFPHLGNATVTTIAFQDDGDRPRAALLRYNNTVPS